MVACDTNATLRERMTEKYGVATSLNWEMALNEVDAVVICTPAPLHVHLASQALTRGRHVLIEKPLSHSWEGVASLLADSEKTPARSAVAYVMHVYPLLRAVRNAIHQGEIGEVKQVTVNSGQPFHRLRPAYAQTYYRDRKTGGGAIQDSLTHSVNWVESVIGPTNSLICDCAHQVLPNVTVEDTVHISARNGATLVNYALNQFQAPKENFIQFNAIRGSIRVELHHQRWGILRESDPEWAWHSLPVPNQDAHFLAQAHAFLDLIEGKDNRLCSLQAAAQTLRFNLAAITSAELGGQRIDCQAIPA